MVRRFVVPKSQRGVGIRYAVAVLSVLAATALRLPFQPVLGQSVPFLLYFPAVLFAAWFGGLGPGLLASVLGALASTFLWMDPYWSFAPFTFKTGVQVFLFLAVSAFMSWLVDLLHTSADSLNAAQRRMEQVLSSMNDGFMIFDRHWRYVYVNESGARIAQLPREQLLGNVVWDLYPDEVGNRGHQELTRAMREQIPVHFEYFYPRFGRWFEFKAYPAQEGLALYVADITEKKHLQEAITRQLEQRVAEKTAELEGKNQSLEALTYSLAHDLRAPMRSISGFMCVLLDEHGNKLGPDGLELANRVLNSSKHAEKLMANLLEYGRLAHVHLPLVRVDAQALAETIVRNLASEIHHHGGRVKIISPLPAVIANETVLEQALTNLIMNALKYTNDGESPIVSVRSQVNGDMARIVVEDYGLGIAPEHLGKLFKPFERIGGKKPGTGLGLSIVAKGIERMGGRVGVESTPGKGSRFWFELPKA
jgi:PAS domain S-box-containing protein